MIEKNILEGKKVIITGGSSGIGKVLAFAFTDYGAEVGLISRSVDKMEKIILEITEKGGKAIYEAANVTNYEQVKKAVDSLVKRMGGINSLINNAGVERLKLFSKQRPDQIDNLIDTNIKGVMYCTHAALPYLTENKNNTIIITSSLSSVIPIGNMTVYGATKAAVNHFGVNLSKELKAKRLRINSILPGIVDTPLARHGQTEESFKLIDHIKPEFLVPFYIYLVSDKTRSMSGKLINIEHFRTVLPIIENLPPDIPRKWEDMKDILKDKLKSKVFSELNSYRRILDLIIS